MTFCLVGPSGCLLFASLGEADAGQVDLLDSGADAGVSDAGAIVDGGLDGGAVGDGGIGGDGGHSDGGLNDGGLDDGGLDDGGFDDGGILPDAGPPADGGVPGVFAGEPLPQAQVRVRLRLLAMNISDGAPGVPLVVRLPSDVLEDHPLLPETVRVLEGTTVLPSMVDADETQARVYFRVPDLQAEATEQVIYIYWGDVAALVPPAAAPVFPADEYFGVFASFVDDAGGNLVANADFTFSQDGPSAVTPLGEGLAAGSTLTMGPFANEDTTIGVSFYSRWPNIDTAAPVLTTEGESNLYQISNRRAQLRSPHTPNFVNRMRTDDGYLALVVDDDEVSFVSSREFSSDTIDSIVTAAAFFQGLTIGSAAWPEVIDEVRIAKQSFPIAHHRALALSYEGRLFEVLQAPVSEEPVSPPAASYSVEPHHRFLLTDCTDAGCPSSVSTVHLQLSNGARGAESHGMQLAGGDSASAAFIPCPVEGGMTVSVWYRPDNLELDGPARIVTWSKDRRNQVFVLGQDREEDGSAHFVFRGLTNTERTAEDIKHSRSPQVSTLHHLAVSIPAQGSGEDLVFCVDGVCENNATDPQAGTALPTDLETDPDWAVRLGNEFGQERAAPGFYSDVAIWCQAEDAPFLVGAFNARGP